MSIPQIIAEVSFNRPQDETENKTRIVRLYASRDNIYLSYEIGKVGDDTITLELPLEEFLSKLGRAVAEQEVED